MNPMIYLDSNATTKAFPDVVEAVTNAYREVYANPSSTHPLGQSTRHRVEIAREQVSQMLDAERKEVVFTSGGTEAIQLAIRGALAGHVDRRHLITSSVEHPAVREQMARLRIEGYEVDEIHADSQGRLDVGELAARVRSDTALVSLLWANHETGVITDVESVAQVLRGRGVALHVDAVQAVGKLPISVRSSGVDLLSFSAHKFHGPKGVGGLCIRKGQRLSPMLTGGPQEFGLRAGTENVPGIIGLGLACEILRLEMQAGSSDDVTPLQRVRAMRDRFERGALERIPGLMIHGTESVRVGNTSNLHIPGVSAEALLILLGERGICASAGAACSSGSIEPSPVLLGMGYSADHARSSVRFSFSRFNSDAEIDTVLSLLPELVRQARAVERR